MHRRNLLKLIAAAGSGLAMPAVVRAQRSRRKPIVLYCDLAVDPARE